MSRAVIERGAELEGDRPAEREQAGSGSLYRAVWRWHFYAGLITAPILWAVTITGALYVFRTEIVEWRDRALFVVEPGAARLSYEALREIAAKESENGEVDSIVVRQEPDRSVHFVVHAPGEGDHPGEGRHREIYLNPYTGAVLGSRVVEDDFFSYVLQIHRSLMMGTTGRVLSELATSWGLLLMATGVYLWWPRGKTNVGVWLPRVKGNPYAVLRDWHSVTGAYLVILVAIVAFSGQFFTVVWGNGFNTTVRKAGHWPMAWFGKPISGPPKPGDQSATLDRVIETVKPQVRPGDAISFNFPEKPEQAFQVWLSQRDDKNTFRMVAVDRYTAETMQVVDSTDLKFLYRVRLWAVSTHMGKIFGLTTEILAFVATLAMLGFSVTGVFMWWLRRPKGRTGIPRRPAPRSVPNWGWAIVALGGLLLPVAGASMVVIALLDLAATPLRKRWA